MDLINADKLFYINYAMPGQKLTAGKGTSPMNVYPMSTASGFSKNFKPHE